jgi:hypothetical protein
MLMKEAVGAFVEVVIANFENSENESEAAAGDARRAIALMRAEPLVTCETAPADTTASRHWEAVLAMAGASGQAPAAASLRRVGGALRWNSLKEYYGAPAAGLSDDMAACSVAGREGGLFATRTYGLFLLLLGPHTLYPLHAHPMIELYYPLAGTADWKRGNEGWAPKAPGTFIHHPSGVAHATRPGTEPMLAFGVVFGDLGTPAVLI